MRQDVIGKRDKITLLNKRGNPEAHKKLLVTWIGSYLVTRAETHSSRVRHLASTSEHDVHSSSLKFYADSDVEFTDELLEHVAAQGIILTVETSVDHRWNSQTQPFELLPLPKDVTVLVRGYVESAKDNNLAIACRSLSQTRAASAIKHQEDVVCFSCWRKGKKVSPS
ncbi:Hypothetical protein PHPALM_3066 [Phytophthora palmivora]|uniref:Uncharacterized protein n=1 Tax=Phytophthora palmivora TaxID=4796 RepID=A0A2P4YNB7_9STRA|nr:Hypothetical protein PHPALM_3066 [Phytophthora palmivora]